MSPAQAWRPTFTRHCEARHAPRQSSGAGPDAPTGLLRPACNGGEAPLSAKLKSLVRGCPAIPDIGRSFMLPAIVR